MSINFSSWSRNLMEMEFLFSVLIAALASISCSRAQQNQHLCKDFLLSNPGGVPDSHITASSSLAPANSLYTGPERARLQTKAEVHSNGTVSMGGWRAGRDARGEYVQVTFDDYNMIDAIVTQGRNMENGNTCCNEYVAHYKVQYTTDGTTWTDAKNAKGQVQVFEGNKDTDTPVIKHLDCPIFVKGVRIIPQIWNEHMSMRFDVVGCYLDDGKLSPQQQASSSTASASTSVGTQSKATAPTSPQNFLPGHFNPILPGAGGTTGPRNPVGIPTQTTTGKTGLIPTKCYQLVDCATLPDGDYQACGACHGFLTCSSGVGQKRGCPQALVWDDVQKDCEYKSKTCV